MYINLLLFCCCAVTVVCFVTDIIIECMKILLLLFCILTWYIYLSPLQLAPYINHPFIVCCIYLYLPMIHIIFLFSVLMCCLVVMVTTVLIILSHVWLVHRHLLCLSICIRLLYLLCINVKVWNTLLPWQPNLCSTIMRSGWNWHCDIMGQLDELHK